MLESGSPTASSGLSADASDAEVFATTTDDEEASSSVGVIAGAVVGVIAGVVVGAVVGVAFVMTKRTAKESDGATASTEVASDVRNQVDCQVL